MEEKTLREVKVVYLRKHNRHPLLSVVSSLRAHVSHYESR